MFKLKKINKSNSSEPALMEGSGERDVITRRDRVLKVQLLNLLKKEGHHKYAERLKDFIVQVVKHGDDPETAGISFDEGKIYINEDMLVDPKVDPAIFEQLSVIIRHELCHNLLMHQVRMMKYLSAIPGSHIRMSMSIHELLNAIEDFEISNKAYTKKDREIVKHTWLNGEFISGLVTEDHREAWGRTDDKKFGMTVEEMYDEICKEIAETNNSGVLTNKKSLTLSKLVARLHSFKDVQSEAEFATPEEFEKAIMAATRKTDPNAVLPAEYQEVFDKMKEAIADDPNNAYTPDDIVEMLNQIAAGKAIGAIDIVSPVTKQKIITVYTPEEKQIAAELLKEYILAPTLYNKWYQEIINTIGNDSDITEDDIKDLLSAIKN